MVFSKRNSVITLAAVAFFIIAAASPTDVPSRFAVLYSSGDPDNVGFLIQLQPNEQQKCWCTVTANRLTNEMDTSCRCDKTLDCG